MTINRLMNRLRLQEFRSWKGASALGIILLAGLLIEAISFAQYRYTHRLFEDELDYRVESELTLKSVRVRSILKSNEKLIRNRIWDITNSLNHPDSIYSITRHVVETNDDVMTCFVAFVPGYYSGQDRLFEPVAYRRGDVIGVKQVASAAHDYTQREFYRLAVEDSLSCWSDPYRDDDASGEMVTTYATPITDNTGKTIAAFGIDLSTQGIIDTINTRHNNPSTFFLLLTGDGRLISKPDSIHTQQSDVNAVVSMINDSTYERKFSSTGRSKIITFDDKENGKGYAYFAFMRGQPHWQVVMVCYDKEVFGKLRNMRRNTLMMMLAALSLLGFILYRFNRNMKRLNDTHLLKERTDSELRIAQNIQAEMIPRESISRPDVDVSGKLITALEVGGDLFDYIIRDEKLFFCIGDVSGKGVPSSLVMAVVHSHFAAITQHESNPARIMQLINDVACEGNETNMFVTLFIGVLDLPTGRLRYCNAGHDAPLLIDKEVKPLSVNPNLPIGLFEDFKYGLQEIQLPDEMTLLLYTDGLTEAMNTQHSQFGLQRIIDTATHCHQQGQLSPVGLMDKLHEQTILFADGAQQSDDLTMLAIHYHRPDERNVLDETIRLTNDVKQVPELNAFVKTVAGRLNLEPSLTSQLMLAVEEAVVNVMNYAYPYGSEGDIQVVAQATEQALKFIIIDQGKSFDPTSNGKPDTSLSAEERPIGGLGILLVQQLMDTINYERVDGKNILTISKKYNKNTDDKNK